MPRPPCCRRVAGLPPCRQFKPAGVPAATLPAVTLGVDELEALRLADLEGLYHEQAAARMGVSRATFGRIVESARRTAARALVEGLVLRIEGGAVEVPAGPRACAGCGHRWRERRGPDGDAACPRCGGQPPRKGKT